jgi:hypothetical protein
MYASESGAGAVWAIRTGGSGTYTGYPARATPTPAANPPSERRPLAKAEVTAGAGRSQWSGHEGSALGPENPSRYLGVSEMYRDEENGTIVCGGKDHARLPATCD